MIQIFSNTLGMEEVEKIKELFENKWIGNGKEVTNFEQKFNDKFKSNYSLMYNSCTSILFSIPYIFNLAPGDEVIVPTIGFVGVANALIAAGIIPKFADVNPITLFILPSEIERLYTEKTRGIFLLQYGGRISKDIFEVQKICKKYNLFIFEDAANSLTSMYDNQYSGTFGDCGCFSFDAMKILSCGDGGMLTIKDTEYYNRAKNLRYFGIVDLATGIDSSKKNIHRWWEFDLDCIGGRFISNNINAAICNIQLDKIDGFIRKRKQIWEIYQSELSTINSIILPPNPDKNSTSSYYLYWIQFKGVNKRDTIARCLLDDGIYTTFRYFPLHMVQFYKRFTQIESLKNAEYVNNVTLNIPLHQNLTDKNVEHIIDCIKKYSS